MTLEAARQYCTGTRHARPLEPPPRCASHNRFLFSGRGPALDLREPRPPARYGSDRLPDLPPPLSFSFNPDATTFADHYMPAPVIVKPNPGAAHSGTHHNGRNDLDRERGRAW